jgi:uncharacterized protein YuzB (UPF0349 family)
MANLTQIGYLNKANAIKTLLNMQNVMNNISANEIPCTHHCTMCEVSLAKLSDYKVIQGDRFCQNCFDDLMEEKNQAREIEQFSKLESNHWED